MQQRRVEIVVGRLHAREQRGKAQQDDEEIRQRVQRLPHGVAPDGGGALRRIAHLEQVRKHPIAQCDVHGGSHEPDGRGRRGGILARKGADARVGLVGHVEDVQQGRRADLARHGGAEHDHDHDHQHILTPAAKAAERRPAMKTKAIMSAAAMSVAATVDRSEPSVRRTMSPRLMSWICT